jgi:hypothetical protein
MNVAATASPTPGALLNPTSGPATQAPSDPAELPLSLPVPAPGPSTIDTSYRFGTTQGETREPHNGVEFLKPFGTPVLAAADGTVLFAGDDNNGGPYSPLNWYAYYGNFVLIEHHVPGYEDPIYSLYAHLSDLLVTGGQAVRTGDPIGLVGFSGAAIGPHLHFEVRFGGTAFADARNPEIWLRPRAENGTLTGMIRDVDNLPIPVMPLELRRLDGAGQIYYFSSYEDLEKWSQPPHFENFAIGDIPPGRYELSFVGYTLENHPVEILPGRLTSIEIILERSP